MDKKKPVFEIHLENWNHALHLLNKGHQSDVKWLLDTLDKYKILTKIFVLEDWIKDNPGFDWTQYHYPLFSHGVHHYHDEKADRSPYFNQEGIPFPPSGGFFFRLLPLWYLKWAIQKSGVFWIHPHDLDEQHPRLNNRFYQWKRHVGLKGAKKKLERLIKEIDWHDPRA